MQGNYQPNNMKPADSSDTIAMVIEIVFGFFGILGMGWLYAGNIPIAIAAFIGYIVLVAIEGFFVSLTLGFAACIVIPVNIAIAVISGMRARDYIRNTGAQGSVMYLLIGLGIVAAFACGAILIFTLLFGGLAALSY